MKKFDENKGQLIQTLRDDNDLQKSAVISILEKSDASSWEIKKQILFVENKLAELTRLELAKRKLESDSQVVRGKNSSFVFLRRKTFIDCVIFVLTGRTIEKSCGTNENVDGFDREKGKSKKRIDSNDSENGSHSSRQYGFERLLVETIRIFTTFEIIRPRQIFRIRGFKFSLRIFHKWSVSIFTSVKRRGFKIG